MCCFVPSGGLVISYIQGVSVFVFFKFICVCVSVIWFSTKYQRTIVLATVSHPKALGNSQRSREESSNV